MRSRLDGARWSVRVVTGALVMWAAAGCILPPSETTVGSVAQAGPYTLPPLRGAVRIHVNQVGYDHEAPKIAVVEADRPVRAAQVRDAETATVVWRGAVEPVAGFTQWGGGPFFGRIDFTSMQQPGIYTVVVEGNESPRFAVGEGAVANQTIPLLLDYFRASRADDPGVLRADANVLVFGSQRRKDVRGGWYDASGDISKYLSHLSYANTMNPQQTPLVVWSLAWAQQRMEAALPQRARAMQEEALWGADFLVRMQDPTGFFYVTVFDHWSGDLGSRRLCAFERRSGTMTADYQAAFREGAGMAIAALARVSTWGRSGSFSSQTYLETAQKGYAHLRAEPCRYCDDGQENLIDHTTALLAAAELYAATQSATYLEDAAARVAAMAALQEEGGAFLVDGKRPFWHASDAGLPVVALLRFAQVARSHPARARALDAAARHVRYWLQLWSSAPNPYDLARQEATVGGTRRAGFFVPHDNDSGYWWQGENARLASLATAASWAAEMVPAGHLDPEAVRRFATAQTDWILGRNPFGVCMMMGVGSHNPPPYVVFPGDKGFGDVPGGIANGITGSGDAGEGIAFYGAPGMRVQGAQRWRWLEQWLPHSAWFLMAMAVDFGAQ